MRLAHRLPIDASTGWVSFTMAAVCLAWLVAMFVVQVFNLHREGQPNWLLTWLMVPFVLAGVWTLIALGRQVLLNIAVGTTRVEVSQHPFYPGGTFHGFVSQTGRLHVRWLQVQLVCEEQAIYQQGTDTRRASSRCSSRHAVQPAQVRDSTAASVRSRVRYHDTRVGDALVRIAAQRGSWTLIVRGRMSAGATSNAAFPFTCIHFELPFPPQATAQRRSASTNESRRTRHEVTRRARSNQRNTRPPTMDLLYLN